MEQRDFKTPEYKKWRKAVFIRDRFTCRFPGCNVKGGHLNAHHIKMWAEWPSLRFVVSNGITLCKQCHTRIFGRERDFELTFSEIVASIKYNKGVHKTPKEKKDAEKTNIKVWDIWFKNL